MSHGTGRLYAADKRDKAHLMRAAKPQALALDSIYYSIRGGAPLDQGDYPHCVEFAWRHWLMAAPIMSTWKIKTGTLYRECQEADEWEGTDYDGTSVRAGAKVLTRRGRIGGYSWAFNAADVKRWLLAGKGAVVMGTDWHEEFNEVRPDGFLEEPSSEGTDLGHAYLIIGGDFGKRNAFRVLNSWGTDWGQKGRAWMHFDLADHLIKARGEACTGVEIRAAS